MQVFSPIIFHIVKHVSPKKEGGKFTAAASRAMKQTMQYIFIPFSS
jgi:hypothetical protein